MKKGKIYMLQSPFPNDIVLCINDSSRFGSDYVSIKILLSAHKRRKEGLIYEDLILNNFIEI